MEQAENSSYVLLQPAEGALLCGWLGGKVREMSDLRKNHICSLNNRKIAEHPTVNLVRHLKIVVAAWHGGVLLTIVCSKRVRSRRKAWLIGTRHRLPNQINTAKVETALAT